MAAAQTVLSSEELKGAWLKQATEAAVVQAQQCSIHLFCLAQM